ncbi:hypothetical protein HDU76_010862 [Blyttiomyces sp. JEL0837]|nr:hypothetical protein HDU76_010862 [Blyttiomyces sp. JEL0837]
MEESSTYFKLPLSHSSSSSSSAVFRKDLSGLDAFQRHKKFVNDYLYFYGKDKGNGGVNAANNVHGKSEVQILKEHHKFLRDEDEDSEESSWEQRVAKRYYDKLYKEYCLANLERFKEGKIALRWRTQKEVVEGAGQFTCGNLRCPTPRGPSAPPLKSWEVNFAYREDGEIKNALVKLRLCPGCGDMLNYKKNLERQRQREAEERMQESNSTRRSHKLDRADEYKGTRERRRRREDQGDDADEDDMEHKHGEKERKKSKTSRREKSAKEDSDHESRGRRGSQDRPSEEDAKLHARAGEEEPQLDEGKYSKELASKVWGAPQVLETEKSKEEELDDFFQDLLG